MAMTSVNIRMDANVKKSFDCFCNELGMTMSTAFNLFAKAALRENRIPFELKTDSYFTGENMRRIENGMKAFAKGQRGKFFTMEELEARLDAAAD